MTIKNNGVTSITAWQFQVTLPSDVTTVNCAPSTVAVCSYNATSKVLTVTNGSSNGTIAAGGSTTINNAVTPIKFTTATANYVLQNVTVSATYAATYETISGLTVTVTKGKKTGGKYPVTVTITNNSGQNISGWQVTIPTTATCTSTVQTGITYTCTTTVLTYTGAAIAIASGAQYTFSTTVTYTPNTWNVTGAAVKGKA